MTGSLTLADYPHEMVRVTCSKCDRRGQLRKSRLVSEHGAEIRLPDLLLRFAIDCPKRLLQGNDPCGVLYPDLMAGDDRITKT